MKSWKTFSVVNLLAFASAVALLCAGFIAQAAAGASSEAKPLEVAIWQRETQTLVMIGIYFAGLALLAFLGKFVFIKK
jgi:hypothetical protein